MLGEGEVAVQMESEPPLGPVTCSDQQSRPLPP